MKRFFKLKHYLAFLRRQPTHIQHLYAFIFAGTITSLLAGFILYTDYGFWHERYVSTEEVATTTEVISPESPTEMLSNLFNDARTQFKSIGKDGTTLLEGKDSFKR